MSNEDPYGIPDCYEDEDGEEEFDEEDEFASKPRSL